MGSIEVISIAIVIVFGALMLPILFEENPAAFLENSLCVIITGPTNTTCNAIGGNVTFVGLNGIDIFANNTENTVYWNFTGSVPGGNQTDETHTNIGGGAEVFKNETAFNANFRTITGFGGILITQFSETIRIDGSNVTGGGGNQTFFPLENLTNVVIDDQLSNSNTLHYNGTTMVWENINMTTQFEESFPCEETASDNDILIYNGTTMMWECISSDSFVSNVIFDNDDFFFPHLCAGEASDPIQDFTEYKLRAIEYDTDKDCNWQFIAPENVGEFNDIKITIWFYKDKTDAGTVCFQVSFLPLAIGEDLDGTFIDEKEVCQAMGAGGVDDLRSEFITWTDLEHSIDPLDMVVVKINRDGLAPDDYGDPVWSLGAEVEWVSSP